MQQALASESIDDLIYVSDDTRLLGLSSWLTSLNAAVSELGRKVAGLAGAAAKRLTGAARAAHRETMRSVLAGLVSDEPFRVAVLGKEDLAVEQGIGGHYDAVFAGHTHFRRIARRPGGKGVHVNTGTWTGVLRLTPADLEERRFIDIYDALIKGDRDSLSTANLVCREATCTVACMKPEGSSQARICLGRVDKRDDGMCIVEFPPETSLLI